MATELTIKNVFRLSNGITVLACDGGGETDSFVGREAALVANGKVRQRVILVGERTMINRTSHLNERAIETRDQLSLTSEEAQSGSWCLVCE